jgi:hypothetical protein
MSPAVVRAAAGSDCVPLTLANRKCRQNVALWRRLKGQTWFSKGGMRMAESDSVSERQRWEADLLRQDKDLALKEKEIDVRAVEARRSRWSNPLVLAIVAATVAALGNMLVTYMTGVSQRDLESKKTSDLLTVEEQKAEAQRILEMIKTGNDPDKAAENLKLLVDTNLIKEPLRTSIANYLNSREKGKGASLPADFNQASVCRGPTDNGKRCGPGGLGTCSNGLCLY